MANILIIDDSGMSRKKLRNILVEDGHTVVGEGRDGLEGLEKYKSLLPDLVTLDITMPNMDGLACLSEILSVNEEASVVMISALGKGDTILDALNSGAVNYITKPFEKEQVQKIITLALESDDDFE